MRFSEIGSCYYNSNYHYAVAISVALLCLCSRKLKHCSFKYCDPIWAHKTWQLLRHIKLSFSSLLLCHSSARILSLDLIWNFMVKPVIVMNITKRIIFYTSQLHVVSIFTYIYSCILMPHAMSGFQGQYHKGSPAEMHSTYL